MRINRSETTNIMDKKYVYVVDKELHDTLLSKKCRLLNTFNANKMQVWVFEYNPCLFSLFENKTSKDYFMTDKLKMTF